MAGHSTRGEAFNEGPRQKAYRMANTGAVRFPVTTQVPAAQAFFDQGVGQLHGFWYFEAERTFRQVAAMDPDCAMAYWGMAMANVENENRAKAFIEQAEKRRTAASRREQMWIDAYAAFLKADRKDNKLRKREYLRSIESIIHEFPGDIEAKAFLAVRLWQYSGDLPIPSTQAVDALLDQVFAVEPMHPAHHYRIHIWDSEKPKRALASAARCGQAAPSIAHMWHMSGHTYSHVQRYADAVWQQEASARVDHAHMMRDRVLPDQIHNYAHNQEWLARNLCFVGRIHDAVDLAKNLIELPRHPKYNSLSMSGKSASYGRTRLFEILSQYELADELLRLANTDYLEPTDIPAEQIKRLRALGAAHYSKRNDAGLNAIVAELESRRKRADQARDAARKKAEDEAIAQKKPKDQIEKARNEAGREQSDETNRIDKALAELALCQALLAGDVRKATDHLAKVTDLEQSRLIRTHLDLGDLAKAESLARNAVKVSKNQVLPLAQLTEVLHRAGRKKEASESFEHLRELSAHIDLDVPIFQRLSALAKEKNLPADWRIAAKVATDVGDRPPLDSLGPFRWRPMPAADWSLPDHEGKTVSLNQFRGRPVVVIFYLGHGCLHCVEQLRKFAPRATDFKKAGIALVAISSDPQPDLTKSLTKYDGDGPFPFPILSDVTRSVFKAYRAFDDFEDRPLHATLIIDEAGLARWQDISFEPFADVEFVLREARRLLSHPAGRPIGAAARG